MAQGLGEGFYWTDFELESSTTGDGAGEPGKYILTIVGPDDEEYATVVHRVCDGQYPLEGDLAKAKQVRAQRIVEALNAY